jgi:NAD(P)-dependent dehydrogenase (short-subunit alcohol dehydrogenase family)
MEGAAEICPTHFRGLASRAGTMLVAGNCMKIPGDSMAGRVALVTGAASGIGRATAGWLAEAGARVTLVDQNASALAGVAAEIGGSALVAGADVTDEAALNAAVAATEARWGRLDYVVANAGGNGRWAGIAQLTAAEFRRTIDINLTGSFLTLRAAVPAMRRGGGGAAVLIGSVNGTRMFSNSGATAYAAAKAGQLAMGRMLALELARDKIRVNSVCPGAIRTAILAGSPPSDTVDVRYPVKFPEGSVPLTGGHVGETRQVAETVWFLLSDLSSHTTGTEVFVDGAQSLIQG